MRATKAVVAAEADQSGPVRTGGRRASANICVTLPGS